MNAFILLIVLTIITTHTFCNSDFFEDSHESIKPPYQLLAPNITVCRRGFLVSIPYETGVSYFEFHGNINSPINFMTPGYFSNSTTKPINGEFIYRNNIERLQIGDTIYYWMLVKKDVFGYIKIGNYTVQKYGNKCNRIDHFEDENEHLFSSEMDRPWIDLKPNKFTQRPLTTTTERVTTTEKLTTTTQKEYIDTTPYDSISQRLEDCETDLSSIIIKNKNITNELRNLKMINSIMKNDIEKTITKGDALRTLLLGGAYPESEDPQSWLHLVLFEKLRLDNVFDRVENNAIRRDEDGVIVFKAKTFNDKLDILLAVDKYLQNSKIWIKNP